MWLPQVTTWGSNHPPPSPKGSVRTIINCQFSDVNETNRAKVPMKHDSR